MRKLTFLLMPFCVSFFIANDLVAQTLMQIDSSLFIRDTLKPLAKRFENIRISGYMQPQYQTIASTGAATYAGGDFQENSNSRFMLRRGRLRVDYLSLTREGYPKLYFAFQFDGTERGVNIRDFWGKFYENKWSVFSITTGVFGRPFGFEVDYSSTVREAPERGRMSQILLQTERDIGVMLRFEPQRRDHRLKWLSVDAGLFNGQGLPGRADFDSKKDFITRVSVGPFEKNQLTFNGSVSSYLGGIRQFTKYKWTEGVNAGGDNAFLVDSSLSNIGKIAKRNYFSADGQLKIKSGNAVQFCTSSVGNRSKCSPFSKKL
jgi:hypothetical protein